MGRPLQWSHHPPSLDGRSVQALQLGTRIGPALLDLWFDPLSSTQRGVQPEERTDTQFHALVSIGVSPHPWATSWCC